jgi:hypothetical protein
VNLDASVIAKVVPQSVRDDPAKMAQVGIYYQHLRWSPNGRVLALDFGEQQWGPFQGDPSGGYEQLITTVAQGLVTIEAQTGAVDVLVLTPSASTSSGNLSGTSFAPASAIRWDLATGTASTVQVPQALSYTWGQDGTLLPVQPLPSSPDAAPPSVAPGPVGNPDGGQIFSIWQTLMVNVDRYCPLPDQPNLSPPPTPYFAVSATVSAWSPDGRYLIEPFTVMGRLAMKPAFASAVGAGGGGDGMAAHTALAPLLPLSCGGPLPPASAFAQVPVRDAGMRSALATLTDYGSLNLTWSPTGTRIVISTGSYTEPTIVIYDARTGAVAAQFSADATRFGLPVASPTAQPHFLWLDGGAAQGGWSPDGNRLLLIDPLDGMVVIVGPNELGG